MESELFEHILYRLPGEQSFTGYKSTGSLPASGKAEKIPAKRKDFYRYRRELLDFWPANGSGVVWYDSEQNDPQWEYLIPQEKHCFSFEIPKASNRISNYIKLLLECESRRLLSAVEACRMMDERDCLYWVTLSLRKWSDYLVEASSQLRNRQGSDEFSQFVRTVLERHLMALICELCERYDDLSLKNYYTPESIYPDLLNRAEPDSNPLKTTPGWFENRAVKLITKQDRGKRLHQLLLEIRANKGSDDFLQLLRVQFYVENAFFLVLYEASFIQDSPGKLEDSEFVAEWIKGIRKEILAGKKFEELKKTITQLHGTADQMQRQFGHFQHTEQPGITSSEAMQFVSEIKKVEADDLAKLTDAAMQQTESVSDKVSTTLSYAQQLKNRFMTPEEVNIALRIGNRNSRHKFFERTEFRYVEVSPQKKLIYREDVEQFIKKNTKRFKPS